VRYLVILYIRDHVPKGAVIKLQGLYKAIYAELPKQCQALGLTNSAPIELKWKNDIRQGLRDATAKGLIKHVGLPKSGEYQRL
jgi:hypothetical protein